MALDKEQHALSQFINTLRAQLTKRGFFEHHLYSTLAYKIENTDTFRVKDGLYLRYNPEPDIWQVGEKYDKFFWIGSMFRNEKKLDKVHRYEFTVADIYLKYGSMAAVVKTFKFLLKILERKLNLKNLSELKVRYLSYTDFAKWKKSKNKDTFWLVLTDYPVNESFYDMPGKDKLHTSKFEIFYVNKNECIEIAACGQLGENINKYNYIKNAGKRLSKEVAQKKFVGFGFGLERLIYLYNR